MDDKNSPPSLDDLAARVKQARGQDEDKRRTGLEPGMPGTALGIAFRVGVELVAGVVVGAAIGYGLDQWLGTTPWLMIVFFFLGAAGGMMNVYRAATGQSLAVGYRQDTADKPDGDKPDGGTREG
jgi:ATP synthase protein I